jgi:NADPH-dependent 2,4-dienoyl-CoA reductase/sulfur reductase-like enzyme/rhodanese-related sulfurtransferase
VATPESLRSELGIDVRVGMKATAIDRVARTVTMQREPMGTTTTSTTTTEMAAADAHAGLPETVAYDKLVLAPGAHPIVPPWPGVQMDGIFSIRSIPDVTRVRAWLEAHGAAQAGAAIVGGGFIGVEMAENLKGLGIGDVTVLDMAPQVLPPFDAEIAAPMQRALENAGVRFILGDPVVSFDRCGATDAPASAGPITVRTKGGAAVTAGIVILAIGVRPATELASAAGLELGERGGVRVDEFMRTSDPDIYAVGDVVECRDRVTQEWHPLALAGPANRQGRVAASHIAYELGAAKSPASSPPAPKPRPFLGVLNTSIVSACGLTAAMTGASERALKRAGINNYVKAMIAPGSHVTYYPNASPLSIKLICEQVTGRILGAQAVGKAGVARRIDVISAAMSGGLTGPELIDLELAYSPQHGAAKDPVNIAGMVIANINDGLVTPVYWDDIVAAWAKAAGAGDGEQQRPQPGGDAGTSLSSSTLASATLVDVRTAAEFAAGHVKGSINIPYAEVRTRSTDVPADAILVCVSGQRAFNASRALRQGGGHDEIRIVAGGFRALYDSIHAFPHAADRIQGKLWDPSYDDE